MRYKIVIFLGNNHEVSEIIRKIPNHLWYIIANDKMSE